MNRFQANLTPEQFEIAVQEIVPSQGAQLKDFKVVRREALSASDGEYEVDVTARFEALSVNFLVLIECKHHKSPIKREVIQILNDRLRSIGAQKGILVATSRFQSGALDYATQHGIALISLVGGSFSYVRRSHFPSRLRSSTYVASILNLEQGQDGEPREVYTVLSRDRKRKLLKALGIVPAGEWFRGLSQN